MSRVDVNKVSMTTVLRIVPPLNIDISSVGNLLKDLVQGKSRS